MPQNRPKVRNPEVLAKAEAWGVDLTRVRASSDDGVIEHDDVFRSKVAIQLGLSSSASVAEIMAGVSVLASQKKRRDEVAAQARAEQEERQRLECAAAPSGSFFSSRVAAKGPTFRLNPLGDDARAALAKANLQASSPPPTLFASGDLPTFTASGIPVDQLLDVAWFARHALAAAPTQADAFEIYQRCTTGDAMSSGEELADEYSTHPSNQAYAARVKAWYSKQAEAAIDEDAWFAQLESRAGSSAASS